MDLELALKQLRDPLTFNSAKEAERIANNFEDALLGIESMPDDYFKFVCAVLSDAQLIQRPGLYHLVVRLYTDKEKLSHDQLLGLFGAVKNNYENVRDENLALTLCDFLARAVSPNAALALLREMSDKAGAKGALTGVLVGLDIIARADNVSDVMRAQAIKQRENAESRLNEL